MTESADTVSSSTVGSGGSAAFGASNGRSSTRADGVGSVGAAATGVEVECSGSGAGCSARATDFSADADADEGLEADAALGAGAAAVRGAGEAGANVGRAWLWTAVSVAGSDGGSGRSVGATSAVGSVVDVAEDFAALSRVAT